VYTPPYGNGGHCEKGFGRGKGEEMKSEARREVEMALNCIYTELRILILVWGRHWVKFWCWFGGLFRAGI
jgi:hypothetical protein